MMQAKELKSKTVEQLNELDKELARAIFDMTSTLRVTRKIEKPHLLREKKKDRARVLTTLRAKTTRSDAHGK